MECKIVITIVCVRIYRLVITLLTIIIIIIIIITLRSVSGKMKRQTVSVFALRSKKQKNSLRRLSDAIKITVGNPPERSRKKRYKYLHRRR